MGICLIIYSLVAACVAASAAEALLHALGFQQRGIRDGSPAAVWQARWRGPGNKTDFFAKLQSWGAVGLPGHYNVCLGVIGFFLFLAVADNV